MKSSTSKENWTPAYILVLLIPIGFIAAGIFWCFSARRHRRSEARRNQDLEVAAAAATQDTPLRTSLHPQIPSRALLSDSVAERRNRQSVATPNQTTDRRFPNASLAVSDPAPSSRKHGPRRYNSGAVKDGEQPRNKLSAPPLPSSCSTKPPRRVSPAPRHRHVHECGPRRRREHHKKVASLRSTTEVLEEASEEGSVSPALQLSPS
jgi:hypothetical protein